MPALIALSESGQHLNQTASRRQAPVPALASAFECVYLTLSARDYRAALRLLAPAGIRVHRATSLHQADRLLGITDALVLLSDGVFLGGTWKDSCAMLARSHPRVALVVASRSADESFWIDVLEEGAYDLVSLPFSESELRRVVENAQAQATYGGGATRCA